MLDSENGYKYSGVSVMIWGDTKEIDVRQLQTMGGHGGSFVQTSRDLFRDVGIPVLVVILVVIAILVWMKRTSKPMPPELKT